MDGFSQPAASGEGHAPRRQGVGRPSIVAPYAPQIAQWLCDEPGIMCVEILRRIRLMGYRGGKSALYDLVSRLRELKP